MIAEIVIGRLREFLLKLVDEPIGKSPLRITYTVAYNAIKSTRGKIAVIIDNTF